MMSAHGQNQHIGIPAPTRATEGKMVAPLLVFIAAEAEMLLGLGVITAVGAHTAVRMSESSRGWRASPIRLVPALFTRPEAIERALPAARTDGTLRIQYPDADYTFVPDDPRRPQRIDVYRTWRTHVTTMVLRNGGEIWATLSSGEPVAHVATLDGERVLFTNWGASPGLLEALAPHARDPRDFVLHHECVDQWWRLVRERRIEQAYADAEGCGIDGNPPLSESETRLHHSEHDGVDSLLRRLDELLLTHLRMGLQAVTTSGLSTASGGLAADVRVFEYPYVGPGNIPLVPQPSVPRPARYNQPPAELDRYLQEHLGTTCRSEHALIIGVPHDPEREDAHAIHAVRDGDQIRYEEARGWTWLQYIALLTSPTG